MKKLTVILTVIAIMFATNIFAQRTTDIKGAKDYPMVSRFKGSVIEWYQVKNFDRYYMLFLKNNKLDKYEVDGKITRIQYSSQKEHSVFEIYKSYDKALKDAGFEILLTLDKNNCGVNLSEQLYIGEFNGLNAITARESIKPDYRDGEFAYLSAKKKIDGKNIYVVVYITNWNYPLITFDAIEENEMEKDLVTVKDLETNLSQQGHTTLKGVFFETGKATLTEKSNDALKNIAEYLKSHSSKKFYIVGHTDNVGDFESNMILSTNRAKAVMTALITKYGIDANQIKAYGVASLSPITTNNTDKGKALNRRVEIVEM